MQSCLLLVSAHILCSRYFAIAAPETLRSLLRGRFSAGLRSGRASRNGTGFGYIFRRHGNPGRIVWLCIVDAQKLSPHRHNCNCRLFIDRYHCWPCPGGKRYQYINTIGGFFENWFERTGAVVPVDTRRPRRVSETHCHGNPITGMAPNH